MANKKFGVKEFTLIGSSGSPTLQSPNNLNLNANTVAISTDVSIGGKIVSDLVIDTTTGNYVGVGSTTPAYFVDVVGGDIRAGINTSQGLILTAANGTKYRLSVSNAGALQINPA
jgi:hypothetical protein